MNRHTLAGILTIIMLIIISLLVVACGSAEPDATEADDPYAVFTEAAQTALAKGQELAQTTPSPTTDTTPAAPGLLTPTGGGPTATTQSGEGQEPAQSGDSAEFVRDISIPDGTELPPRGNFTKTWRLKNVGTTTWTTDYKVVFIGGDRMGAADATPLTQSVAPNQDVEISVNLVAPEITGSFTGYFNLQNQNGDNFGVGVGSIEAFWVEITVSEDAAPIATSTPSVSEDVVTQVFLYTDITNVNVCPHTYNFRGIITLSESAPVTYKLEASSTTPGFVFDLPQPVTMNLNAGSHNLEFPLTFTSDVQGFVQLHVTFPGDHLSNPVNFILDCP